MISLCINDSGSSTKFARLHNVKNPNNNISSSRLLKKVENIKYDVLDIYYNKFIGLRPTHKKDLSIFFLT